MHTITLSAFQLIKLEFMIGVFPCDTIRSMNVMSGLFKKVCLPRDVFNELTFTAGNDLMIKTEAAQAAMSDIALTTEEAAALTKFLTEWKGTWRVGDNEWVMDLLSKL